MKLACTINSSVVAKSLFSVFRNTLFLILASGCFSLFAQNDEIAPVDTLNKLNANKKKTGYWSFYLDEQYNKCPKKSAKYIGFMRYTEGKTQVEPIARDNKKDRMFFQAFSDTSALALYNFDLPENAWVTGDKAYNDYMVEDIMRDAGLLLLPFRKRTRYVRCHLLWFTSNQLCVKWSKPRVV